MPINSVNEPAKKQRAREMDKNPPGHAIFLLIHGSTLLINAFPAVNMITVNINVRAMVRTNPIPSGLSPLMERMMEKINLLFKYSYALAVL